MTVPSYLAFTVISVLSLALAVSSLTLAQDPTREPPLDNVAPPLNTSSSSQIKSGGLSVGSLVVGGSEEGVVISTQITSNTGPYPAIIFPEGPTQRFGTDNPPLGLSIVSRLGSIFLEKITTINRAYKTQLRGSGLIVHSYPQEGDGERNLVTLSDGSLSLRTTSGIPGSLRTQQAWLNNSGLVFRSSKNDSFVPKIISEGNNFDIIVRNGITSVATHSAEIKIRNINTPSDTTFVSIISQEHGEDYFLWPQNNYKARLGINTKTPRYPLDVTVHATTTRPWVAGFGHESLVKIGADGRVAARQYCDTNGENCVDLVDLENRIRALENSDSSSSLLTPPTCPSNPNLYNGQLEWTGSGWNCNEVFIGGP